MNLSQYKKKTWCSTIRNELGSRIKKGNGSNILHITTNNSDGMLNFTNYLRIVVARKLTRQVFVKMLYM